VAILDERDHSNIYSLEVTHEEPIWWELKTLLQV
jgi:hypothetical protein